MAGETLNIKPLANDNKAGEVKDENVKEPTVKEENEEILNREYTDVRSIVIVPIHNYSLFRKSNMKTMGQRKETIGSCVRSSRTLSANKEEVEAYFPNIIGLSPSHQDFVNRVKQYLNNIQVIVSDSLSLNISFNYNTKNDYYIIKAKEDAINKKYEAADKSDTVKLEKALEEKIEALNTLESSKCKYGRPQNFEQYLIYRHCLLYKDVAKDLSLINAKPYIRFYIKDEQREKEKQQKLLRERINAKRNFVELMADDKQFESMYIACCIHQGISLSTALLKDKTEKEFILDKFSNEEPDKFNKLFNDKYLNLKAFIETLISKGELIRSEFNQNISTANGDFVGANMNEAIAYFNNPANAEIRKVYENRLKYV